MLGFLGVLVIVRPGLASFQPAALLVLVAAFAFAISLIATKMLTNRVSTFAIIFWMNLHATADGAAAAGSDPLVPRCSCSDSADAILPAVALGAVGLTSHYCLTNAFRSGDATVVVPLDFLRIPLIALVGWLFYGESARRLRVRRRRPDHLRRAVEPARRIAAAADRPGATEKAAIADA